MDKKPILNDPKLRRESVINDTPATFNIKDNPNADPYYGRWRSIPGLGVAAIHNYDDLIVSESLAQGVDPDLVRSIMYIEHAQGWHDNFAFIKGGEDSIKPMNIKPEEWTGLGYGREDLQNPELNIRSGVKLIKRLQDRIPDATPEKIASAYIYLGRENVHDYGARVGQVYKDKPWEEVEKVNNWSGYEASSGFFGSVGSAIGEAIDWVGDFFGGGSNVGSMPFNPFPARGYERSSGISPADLMRHQLAQRQSKVDIDKILSDAVAKNADSLIDRLIACYKNLMLTAHQYSC